jgi:hypothetical protein
MHRDSTAKANPAPAAGPLRVHPDNPRYFTDGSGRAIYLSGSHTWGNIQDQLSPDPDVRFDFPAYLDWMEAHQFNFVRGWAWEQAAWDNHTVEKLLVGPLPYRRTGPGTALDGRPKFDLTQLNSAYFDRIRSRVVEAGKRGIYVSVMLFQGFSIDNRNPQYSADPWRGHPFNVQNNVNGIDGDPHGTGGGRAVHTLAIPEITAVQERYVRRVVEAVNDLDNVLFEIGNELYAESVAWQGHMIDLIRAHEAQMQKQHPVGMTGGGPSPVIANAELLASPADWISPRHEAGQPYRDDPPATDGSKVILADTDHLWGLGASQGWVWKSFTRGLNPILMDPYEKLYGLDAFPSWGAIHRRDHPMWEPIRRSLTYTLDYAARIDLAAMEPRGELASTGYCLADPGHAYLVYLPDGGKVSVDLSAAAGALAAEWFSPTTGETVPEATLSGGATCHLGAPFGGDAVLYLWAPR